MKMNLGMAGAALMLLLLRAVVRITGILLPRLRLPPEVMFLPRQLAQTFKPERP